jgi:hypothetical protein
LALIASFVDIGYPGVLARERAWIRQRSRVG